jgi:alpha 1,3-glucosidase
MKLSIFLVLLLFYTELTLAVDRSKFKTCDQASFCKRNRVLKEGTSKHSIVQSTINLSGTKITADVSNPFSETATLQLELSGLQDNTVRFKIKEKSPPIKRFEAKDALIIDETFEVSPLSVQKDANLFTVTYTNNTKVVVYYSPIKIEVFKNNLLVVSANSHGLLNFEHFRQKEDPPYLPFQYTTTDEESQKNELKNYWHDSWEETFSTHKDHKPHGKSSQDPISFNIRPIRHFSRYHISKL